MERRKREGTHARAQGRLARRLSIAVALSCGASGIACADDSTSETTAATSTTAGSGGAGGASTSTSSGGSAQLDFSCQDSPWPSTAPDPIHVAGKVTDFVTEAGLGGATVDALAIDDASLLASTTSDVTGAYAFTLPTGGQAIGVYFRVTLAQYVTSYTFPTYALWQDEPSRHLPALSIADRSDTATEIGITLDPAKGIVAVYAGDCNADPVAGASISFSPPPEIVTYVGDDLALHPGDTTTSQAAVVAGNVPAGPLDATIALDDKTWRAWTVESFADSFVWSPRRP